MQVPSTRPEVAYCFFRNCASGGGFDASQASNLVANDGNDAPDVFIKRGF
jgi:hypothetical protein